MVMLGFFTGKLKSFKGNSLTPGISLITVAISKSPFAVIWICSLPNTKSTFCVSAKSLLRTSCTCVGSNVLAWLDNQFTNCALGKLAAVKV